MKDDLLVGICKSAHYYEDMKAIRLEIVFGGRDLKVEWPITKFRFADGMNRDDEMRKTAKLALGSEWLLTEDGKLVLKKGHGSL